MSGVLETYEVSADHDTIEPSERFQGTNAARFAIAATLAGGHGVRGSVAVVPPAVARRFGFGRTTPAAPARRVDLHDALRGGQSITRIRREAWRAVASGSTDAAPLLAAGLCSDLDRESVVAAVALIADAPPGTDDLTLAFERPDAAAWSVVAEEALRSAASGERQDLHATVRRLAAVRIAAARRATDPIVRELASAAELVSAPSARVPTPAATQPDTRPTESTLIHGTWGWAGDWWYPGGAFHTFIRADVAPDLYAGGRPFSWSGRLDADERAVAGRRLERWIGDGALRAAFAHSYGGDVLALAVRGGARVDTAVLLSAPADDLATAMIPRVRRAIDIRLRFDMVLALARAPQAFAADVPVERIVVDQPIWSHGATCEPALWRSEGLAERIRTPVR